MGESSKKDLGSVFSFGIEEKMHGHSYLLKGK
jgi:hypothetical protein